MLNVSTVYVKCTKVVRRSLWSAIEGIGSASQYLWLVAGDFNVVSTMEERLGGEPANVGNMEEFNTAVFNHLLLEVPFDGLLLHGQMVGSCRDLIRLSLIQSGLLFFILPMFHTWHVVVLIMRLYLLSVGLILDVVAPSDF